MYLTIVELYLVLCKEASLISYINLVGSMIQWSPLEQPPLNSLKRPHFFSPLYICQAWSPSSNERPTPVSLCHGELCTCNEDHILHNLM